MGERVAAPLANTRRMTTGRPSIAMSRISDGRIRVSHREYVGDILGSVAFDNTTYSVNPGLNSLFPWLSGLAALFESYEFKSLHFEYETQRAASTNGSVFMAMDYDAADSEAPSKVILMSYHNATRTAVWEETKFACDSADLKKFGPQRFVRTGALESNQDIKTYDIGKLNVATQGCADATAVGELYVCYDVELMTPQLDLGAGNINVKSMSVNGATSISAVNIFGDAPIILGTLGAVPAVNTITFSTPGRYLVSWQLTGTDPVMATIAGTASSTLRCKAESATLSAGSYVVDADASETMIFSMTSGTVSGSRMLVTPIASGVYLAERNARDKEMAEHFAEISLSREVEIPTAMVRQRSMTFMPFRK